MNANIAATLDRLDEFTKELRAEYETCLRSKTVTPRALQLTHDVCEKSRSVLDRCARQYWEQKIARELTADDRERASVYFPITSDLHSFDSTLGRWAWRMVQADHK